MSDLERFGKFVGDVRVIEPRLVRATCRVHQRTTAVPLLLGEVVVLCCILGQLDVPYRMVAHGWQFAAEPI